MMELKAIASDVYACLQEDRGPGTSNSGFIRRGGGLVVDTFWDLPHTLGQASFRCRPRRTRRGPIDPIAMFKEIHDLRLAQAHTH